MIGQRDFEIDQIGILLDTDSISSGYEDKWS